MKAMFRVGDASPWKYFLGVSIALGIIFASLSPEGTTARGPVTTLIQWLAQVMIPMALCISAHVALHRLVRFERLNPWLKLLGSGCMGAVFFSPIAYGIDLFFGGGSAAGVSFLSGCLEELGAVIMPVVFTWIAINTPFQLGFSLRREIVTTYESLPEQVTPSSTSSAREPFFLTLVPEARRGEVLHMKSELHYLSVATSKGQSLILYALRDAIRELPPELGIQTHRSYWANMSHVMAFKMDGRGAVLTMSDGKTLPVSRSKVKELKARLGPSGAGMYAQRSP